MLQLIKSTYSKLTERNHFISWAGPVIFALVLLEVVLNYAVIRFIPYTEIDWKAYMQEVEGVVNGTFDYTQLKGDTGPLVYPAGFVYIYYILYFITNKGANILLGQWIFMGLYLASIATVFIIYKRANTVPLWAFGLLVLSKRVHSIFVLRLFNDCFAMFFLFIAIYLFTKQRWTLGCLIYSFAVSIKMNILLFAPGLLLLLIKTFGIVGTIPKLAICAIVQLVLAVPFLLDNPIGYLVKSFELGRQFIFYWSVNWQFLPEALFLDGRFGALLLALTAVTLLIFYAFKWTASEGGLMNAILKPTTVPLSSEHITTVMFTSNFIGVVFARSLHFQFYSWYFFTLPHLLFVTRLPAIINIALFGAIEVVWNVFPPRPWASALLQACHWAVLLALLFLSSPKPAFYPTSSKNKSNATDSSQSSPKQRDVKKPGPSKLKSN